jgi:hypothetical protein
MTDVQKSGNGKPQCELDMEQWYCSRPLLLGGLKAYLHVHSLLTVAHKLLLCRSAAHGSRSSTDDTVSCRGMGACPSSSECMFSSKPLRVGCMETVWELTMAGDTCSIGMRVHKLLVQVFRRRGMCREATAHWLQHKGWGQTAAWHKVAGMQSAMEHSPKVEVMLRQRGRKTGAQCHCSCCLSCGKHHKRHTAGTTGTVSSQPCSLRMQISACKVVTALCMLRFLCPVAQLLQHHSPGSAVALVFDGAHRHCFPGIE